MTRARSRQGSAILFDLDGTLIDSAPDLAAAADRMLLDRSLPPKGLSAYRHMAGAGAKGMLGVAFGVDSNQAEFEALRQEFLNNYAEMLMHQTQVFDGVKVLLKHLSSRGISWGIVTNKAGRFVEPLVRGLPILAGAAAVIAGDTTPYTKPHPEPLLEAARRLSVDAACCVYVGDDERDIVAGHAAGMITVAACYGYLGTRSDPQEWRPDLCIASPLQLLNWLELT